MRLVYSPNYEIEIIEHPWQINKYIELYKIIISEKIVDRSSIIIVDEADDEDLLLIHTKDYITKLKTGTVTEEELFQAEIPYSKELIRLFWTFAQGTIVACRRALEERIAVHIGGGMHHAYPDHGSGFCLLNDIAIAIRKIKSENLINKALIVDCDVHQGDGTAKIFEKDSSVFTFSIHQENIFPGYKQKSDLDIGLEDGMQDEEYLYRLKENIPYLIESHRPDLILYVAGADTYKGDSLGGLNLTIDGLRKRDDFIFNEAMKNNVPVSVVLAGGYAINPHDTVKIHLNTILSAKKASTSSNKF